MCAVRADGFLPSKVSMLGGSNDCIPAFSPENYHFSSQVMFFGKGRLLFRELAVSSQNPHKKNSLRKASTQNKFYSAIGKACQYLTNLYKPGVCRFNWYCSSPDSATERSPVHAVITKIDRMKTRQGESLFLKVDVGGETVRVFGRPEELAERLEASGYDIPASEIEAGMELHLPCLVKVGQGNNGYKNIEEFLPEAAE